MTRPTAVPFSCLDCSGEGGYHVRTCHHRPGCPCGSERWVPCQSCLCDWCGEGGADHLVGPEELRYHAGCIHEDTDVREEPVVVDAAAVLTDGYRGRPGRRGEYQIHG